MPFKNIFDLSNYNNLFLALIIGTIYFLALFSQIGNLRNWRGDERFYTDAAIQMVQSGDWITPRYPDNSPRYNKPGMTYWAVATSYKLFGISPAASRIPPLLAGTFIIILTFLIGIIIYNQKLTAIICASIMASLFMTIKMSLRVTPDIFLCLFITISLYGFIRFIYGGKRNITSIIPVYTGAALAILTKGSYGFMLPLMVFFWISYDKPFGIKIREIISIKVLLLTIPIALAWYILIFIQHGPAALSQFMNDQVTSRVHNVTMTTILWHFLNYIVQLLRNLLPWSIFAIVGRIIYRNESNDFTKEYRTFIRMVVFLLLISILIFSVGNIFRSRYLFPLYPLICVIIGGGLSYLFKRKTGNQPYIILIVAISIFSGTVTVKSTILSKQKSIPSYEITKQLLKRNIVGKNIAIMKNNIAPDLSSHIRLLSSGRINPAIIQDNCHLAPSNFAAIILPTKYTNNINKNEFYIIPAGYYKKHKSEIHFLIAVRK